MTELPEGADAEDEAGSVLVLAPDIRETGPRICTELLTGADESIDHVVPVTIGQSPDGWLDVWERTHDGGVDRVTCIDIDRPARSAAASAADGDSEIARIGDGPDVTVETVADLTDLTELGTTITNAVWDAGASDERVGVAVHSLTDLLQYVDRQQAFFFVITLADRVRREGGVAYVHLDGECHDENTVDVFKTACDAVFEAEEGVGLEL